jgi:hypothetical protein
MKDSNNSLAKELSRLINNNLDLSMFPYVKGTSIRIKNVIIRQTKFGFIVFDVKEQKNIGTMFCKTSAVALAKSYLKGNGIPQVLELDRIIEKNYNDAVFHRYTMKKTKDSIRYDVASTRYDISAARTEIAKKQLDSYIY